MECIRVVQPGGGGGGGDDKDKWGHKKNGEYLAASDDTGRVR